MRTVRRSVGVLLEAEELEALEESLAEGEGHLVRFLVGVCSFRVDPETRRLFGEPLGLDFGRMEKPVRKAHA